MKPEVFLSAVGAFPYSTSVQLTSAFEAPGVLCRHHGTQPNIFEGRVGAVAVEAPPSAEEAVDCQDALGLAFVPQFAAIP